MQSDEENFLIGLLNQGSQPVGRNSPATIPVTRAWSKITKILEINIFRQGENLRIKHIVFNVRKWQNVYSIKAFCL
jgi:hypothetical protein